MIISELLELFKSIKDLKDGQSLDIKFNNARSSISREAYSNSGVLNFPVLVSGSLSLDNVTMVSKALERNYVSFLTILTSFNSITDEQSISKYIKKFHQNVDEEDISPFSSKNLKDISNTNMRNIFRESSNLFDSQVFCLAERDVNFLNNLRLSENSIINLLESCCKSKNEKCEEGEDISIDDLCSDAEEFESCNKKIKKCSDNKCDDNFDEYDYVVNYDELDNDEQCKVKKAIKERCRNAKCECFKYRYNTGIKSLVLKESTGNYTQVLLVKNLNNNSLKLLEAQLIPMKDVSRSLYTNILKESYENMKDYTPDLNMDSLNERTIINNNYSMIGRGYIKDKYTHRLNEDIYDAGTVGATGMDISDGRGGTSRQRLGYQTVVNMGREPIVPRDILRDNDVKKANELIPTTVHLKTYFKNNERITPIDYMIGIKATVHKIDSQSMIENVAKSLKRGKAFFNLMRVTSGEISFFKDFVFAITRIKDDVKSKHKDNPWWDALYRRKKSANLLKGINASNQLVPNATLVLSMDEVEYIKNQYGFDLMNDKVAKDVIKQLFLLGFVVVDSSIQVAYFLFDGARNYQSYSFNALERENSNASKNVKEIMQVLGRM